MSNSLYEISGELATTINRYNSEDMSDEAMLELETVLTGLSVKFADKVNAVAMHMRNREADIEAIATETKRLNDRADRLKHEIEWFTKYIKNSMEFVGETEIKTPLFTVKIVNNPGKVEIEEGAVVPDEYTRIIPEKREPDKKLIATTLKSGIGVNGCRFVQSTRLSIK